MSTLLIEGGQRLSGAVDVEGNKNAALPLLAACLLTRDACVLSNVPRISDVEVMARLLLDLGAEVEGIGSTTLRVRCPEVVKDEPDPALVGRLRGSVLLIGPLLARRGRAHIAPPGGDFPARRTITTHLEALAEMGVRLLDGPGHELEAPDGLKPRQVVCTMDGDGFRVERSRPQAAGRITTGLWPGFPSDLVSLVTVLATQTDGRTLVHDWLYELRLFALEQLSGMSADLFLCDPHRIIVTGPRRLRGRPLDSRDLRSGMALIAAALAADGQSRLSPLETVERGYGQLVERLQALGAKVAKLP